MSTETLSRSEGDIGARCQGLPPRVVETLDLLMDGGSEKEVALQLGISRHTVHAYVKSLYRHFSVCSRAELMSVIFKASLQSSAGGTVPFVR